MAVQLLLLCSFSVGNTKPLLCPSRGPPPPLTPSDGCDPDRLSGSRRRRDVFLKTACWSLISLGLTLCSPSPPTSLAGSSEAPPAAAGSTPDVGASSPPPRKPIMPGISSTKTWFRYIGDGFSIRVPPTFEDITEPEDYNAGLSLYGDKAKPRAFAARFASPDRSEVLSVVIRPSNQLKITFLEAKDITDFGTLKVAAKIFVPGGASLYSARTIRIREDGETLRNYYYYEFSIDDQHLALVAAVNSGKAIIAGASSPQSKWDEDGVKLRSEEECEMHYHRRKLGKAKVVFLAGTFGGAEPDDQEVHGNVNV